MADRGVWVFLGPPFSFHKRGVMKRLILMCLLVILFWSFVAALKAVEAYADWRWADPQIKPHRIIYSCNTYKCIRRTYVKEKHRLQKKIKRYHHRRLQEWRYWTALYIPDCTWYGESGYGPRYARYRYTLPNSTGSGAYGKFQMMWTTYHSRAKYHDWSPLDQEIAARREFWAHGTSPWTNC